MSCFIEPIKLNTSPVQHIKVNGWDFFVKRDDLIHPDFAGNKARKLYYLLYQDLTGIDKLISYGSAQANSLHSLAVLAKHRQLALDYYVGHIPTLLKHNPSGNYLAALNNGARIIEVAALIGDKSAGVTVEQYVKTQILPQQKQHLFVPEGGRYQQAAVGVNRLGAEIVSWAEAHQLFNLKVALPSGTGTTALFLQQYFIEQALPYEVLTCACVGGDSYLRTQFAQLSSQVHHYPTILKTAKKIHFGQLYPELYQLWRSLKAQTGIEFELLYDPLGWQTLLDYVERRNNDTPILYIHQGGTLGNATMAARYERKLAKG